VSILKRLKKRRTISALEKSGNDQARCEKTGECYQARNVT